MKRFAQIISTIFLILILSSCNKKENIPAEKKAIMEYQKHRKFISDYHTNFLKKLRLKTNRIEVCSYKLSGKTTQDTTKVLTTTNLVTLDKLKTFNTFFDSLKNHGYCCCLKTHYTMKLFNKNKMLKRYNVDTIQRKGKALIFDTDYQTSYVITLKDWHNLIE
ncbi:hypothetical protein L1S35_05380 [Flavobacterium sp. AS60]|uniref:hypothetical protein n=1 Tax=Flavobacterium anseongense TaxID=2910677 RepID=UPI001F2B1DED|nr:hypothetical protein [Flavobacterium sp. AS60]MCF6129097.1 hypothetical protein [Flavobacterium sp. AS60]